MHWHIYAIMNVMPELFFKALADQTRLRCVALLQQEGELCVCELTYALQLVQPKISRHLALLRESGLVLDRREGLWVYYRIHPELPEWATRTLAAVVQGSANTPPFSTDRMALDAMSNRPGRQCCA